MNEGLDKMVTIKENIFVWIFVIFIKISLKCDVKSLWPSDAYGAIELS